jgi:DNA-directed RNA polymerase subunit F
MHQMSCFNSYNFLIYLYYNIRPLIFVNIADLLPSHSIEITVIIQTDETLGVKINTSR